MKQSKFTKEFIVDFDKKLPLLVEYFTRYYGEQYRDLIKQRIEETYITFKGCDKDFVSVVEKSIQNQEKPYNFSNLISQPRKTDRGEFVPGIKFNGEDKVREIYLKLHEFKTKKEGFSAFNKQFIDAFCKFCFDISEVTVSEEQKGEIVKILENYKNSPDSIIPELLKVCLLNACGAIPNQGGNPNKLKAQDIFAKEIDLGPKVGKKPFKEALEYAAAPVIELASLWNDLTTNSCLREDTEMFIKNTIYDELADPDDAIHFLKGSILNCFYYTTGKKNNQFFRFIAYNTEYFADNAIIHELDHAIMHNVKDMGDEGCVLYEGIKKVIYKNGEPIEEGRYAFPLEIIEAVKREGNFDKIKDYYPPIYDRVTGEEVPLHERLADDLVFFNEVCTDFRTNRIIEEMKREGAVIYNNEERIRSSYSKAFAGCHHMFTCALPEITRLTIECRLDELLERIGALNFVILLHGIGQLDEKFDKNNCLFDEDFYYKHKLGMVLRPLTPNEEMYIDYVDQIYYAVKDFMESFEVKDDYFDFLTTAIYLNEDEYKNPQNKKEKGGKEK